MNLIRIKYMGICFVFLSLAFASCQSNKQKKKQNTVSVSILPQKYFIERIAGNDFDVNVLIPPGASPATYEPTPAQMKQVAQSVAYFKIGHIPFETVWLDNLIKNAGNIKLADLSEGVELVLGPEVQHGDHFHAGGIDPHVWSSPKSAKLIVQNAYKELCLLMPDKKEEYKQSLDALLREINELDQHAREAFTGKKQVAFMIFHPALSYLARDYGLEQISIETDGKEPSPANLKQLVTKAKKYELQLIFVQKQFNKENAEAIARETGAKVVQIDPLSENWAKEMRRIIDLLKQN